MFLDLDGDMWKWSTVRSSRVKQIKPTMRTLRTSSRMHVVSIPNSNSNNNNSSGIMMICLVIGAE